MNIEYFEINKLSEGPFEYLLITGPIDWWKYSLSVEQVVENIKAENFWGTEKELEEEIKEFEKKVKYIEKTVTQIEEKPHTIRFTSIPNPNNCTLELVGMAKIENNGTCFIFSNSYSYLDLIKED